MTTTITLILRPFITMMVFFSFLFVGITQVVITEIMYNPPESGADSLEYIELYNNGADGVDMTGASFGAGVIYTFGNFTLDAGAFVVVAVDSAVMLNTLGVQAFQWTSGGLKNSGETITLINNKGVMMDSVTYDDTAPWPVEPDGDGYSLELCDVNADNSNANFWKKSASSKGIVINGFDLFASPGVVNIVTCADHQVIVKNFEFDPKEITIKVGESIEFKNIDGTHNVNGSQATYPNNPSDFLSGAPERAEWSYIYQFDKAGKHDYQCDPHAANGMTGIVNVVEDIIPTMIITEIMYNSPDDADSLEYLEIFNQGNLDINLKGIKFTQGITFTFGDGTLGAGEYVVLAANSNAVNTIYGIDAIQWEDGSLNNSGELIEITSSLGSMIDQVVYSDKGDWREEADGDGRSLVVCDENGDNNSPTLWGISNNNIGVQIEEKNLYGSPGSHNSCDSTQVELPLYPIGIVKTNNSEGIADSIDVKCKIKGIVYGIDLQVNDNVQFTVIDETGGIGVFSSSVKDYEVTEGDEIEITGKIGQFNGLTQINATKIMKISSDNKINDPKLVTGLDESTESQLILMENMKFVDPSKWKSTGDWFTMKITDGNTEYTMYIDDAVDLSTMSIPVGSNFNFVGIGGQFDRSALLDGGYQIIPRSKKDIIPLLGLDDPIAKIEVIISPNPTSDLLNIKSSQDPSKIDLFTTNGKKVHSTIKSTFDISELEKGMYIIQVSFNNGYIYIQKIVKL